MNKTDRRYQKRIRTEEEKLTQTPMTVILGGKPYKVKLLPIEHSRPWRKDVAAALSDKDNFIVTTTEKPEEFILTINKMLVEKPDTIIDLFFGYAKDLNRKEIESIATDSEIAIAFGQVVDMGFLPLAKSLVATMLKLSQ